ncbi:hypothetical protein [Paraburkholderia terricola]|uniref:hypothetical protein n=1 Tax=Paraburkholderia terricola TaxID=169427 RepID=UPI0028561400|nr:hypothetical protein [Paraburkholderia terricola]MDR6481607.1 hypothetical protein [Paraburkholderia terricola]
MPTPVQIPVLPDNISISGPDTVTFESHTLKTLATNNPQLAVDLINEHGFAIDTSKMSWGSDGKVKIQDVFVKDKIEAALKKGNLSALNICGLCQAG